MYTGQATILGKQYITAYQPIISNDKVIGILFTGVSLENVSAFVSKEIKTLTISLLIITLVALTISMVITFMISSNIAKPLILIQNTMNKIANYNLDTDEERQQAEKWINNPMKLAICFVLSKKRLII